MISLLCYYCVQMSSGAARVDASQRSNLPHSQTHFTAERPCLVFSGANQMPLLPRDTCRTEWFMTVWCHSANTFMYVSFHSPQLFQGHAAPSSASCLLWGRYQLDGGNRSIMRRHLVTRWMVWISSAHVHRSALPSPGQETTPPRPKVEVTADWN